jgi:hypothetical protein
MKLSNLFILVFSINSSQTHITSLREAPKRLNINPETDEWSYKQARNIPIGTSNFSALEEEREMAVVGVYDRFNINHINYMVDTAVEVTRSYAEA